MTDAVSAFFERVKIWHMILVALFGVFSWYAGKSGWVGISPEDQIRAIKAEQAVASNERALLTRSVTELRSDISFTVELLCVQLTKQPGQSTGDTYLQRRCDNVTARLLSSSGVPR